MRPTCTMRGIEKAFGPNLVLRGIDLDLPGGQVTALMGANGAGKSTLVKILCGVHRADAGAVELDGAPFAPATPAAAMRAGVATVHQSIDDGVIPDLDVASNLMLDSLAVPGPAFIRTRSMRAQATRIAAGMGLTIDVRMSVARLGIADRQVIAIARAMARDPKILILDEPTSSLSSKEAARLFALIDRLKARGVAILYISHRMSDIRAVADRIVSMRDGAIAGLFEGAVLDHDGAVAAMLGRTLDAAAPTPVRATAPMLSVRGLRLAPGGPAIDMEAGQGEIVAVTGLLGSGKSRLAEILFGLAPSAGGTATLGSASYAPANPKKAIAAGVYLCAKDRAANGIVPGFDLAGNLSLPFLRPHVRGGWLRRSSERCAAAAAISDLGIVARSPRDPMSSLSGGNQQKVMVGRWLAPDCRLLILDEPFQGVDIRARRDIGARLRATAPGRATLVLVAEIDEALEIADRIVVLHEGAVVGEHINASVDLDRLTAQMSGSRDVAA